MVKKQFLSLVPVAHIPVLVKSSFSRVILCSHLVRMRAVFTHEFTLGNLSVSEERRPPVCKVVAWKCCPDAPTAERSLGISGIFVNLYAGGNA